MSNAPSRLGKWIKDKGWSMARFGEELFAGKPVVAQASVSRWLAGASKPDQVHLEAIERMTGIETTAWLTTEERAQLRHVARGAA